MAQERPLIRQLARTIVDVARDASGLVVLFDDDSIERLDDEGTSIAHVATIASTGGGVSELLPLADGRLVVRPSAGVLQVVRAEPGGAATLERMTQLGEHESFGGVVAVEDGFFTWSKRGLLFERGGQRQAVSTEYWIDHAIVTPHGALTWGFQGWFLVTRDGDVVQKGEERFLGATARIGDLLLATSLDGWVALDLTKNTRVDPPTLRGEIARVCAVGDRFVCAREDELVAFDPSFAVLERQRLPWAPKVLAGRGDFVVAAIDDDARVGPLRALDDVPLVGRLDGAVSFGDSIALHDQSPELRIWSPRGVSTITHDARPWRVRSLGDALATTEADVLRIHRPGVDHGEPRVSAAAGPPIGETIVVNGMLGRRVDEGLVAYSLELPGGTRARVPRDAPYRAVIDAASARHVVELLARRDFERAPLDETLAKLDPWSHASWDAVVNRHPKDNVGLFLRGLFEGDAANASAATSASTSSVDVDSNFDASRETSDTNPIASRVDASAGDAGTDADPRLDPRFAIRVLATRTYDRVVAELAWALGRSPLQLIAAIRAGRVAFEDALEVPGFTYLGTFECSGKLVVCDPCHRDKPALRAELAGVAKGTWHVLVREGVGATAGRIAELVATHADGLACSADQEVRALIGVDAGIVGIYDPDCPMPDLDTHFETGPFAERGAHSRSGWGDGGYVAYVARVVPTGQADRRVVKVRVPFFDDGAVDRSVLLPTTSARTYSPRERFTKDELVAHPKFGVGRVVEAGRDRVEIEFRGERRTLVHGRG